MPLPRVPDPWPWEEMAKIDEHRRRDLPRARGVVARANELAVAGGASAAVLEALDHRLARLTRRIGRPEAAPATAGAASARGGEPGNLAHRSP